jgi:hypothetical protein
VSPAYRVKRGVRLWDLVHELKAQGQQHARKAIACLYKSTAREKVRREYLAQLSTRQRNEYDLDVWIVVREHRGRIYLMPRCDMTMRGVLDFMETHPSLEDFSYWNNCDRPEEVSAREWAIRRGVWNKMLDEWRTYMVIEIVSYDGFRQVES